MAHFGDVAYDSKYGRLWVCVIAEEELSEAGEDWSLFSTPDRRLDRKGQPNAMVWKNLIKRYPNLVFIHRREEVHVSKDLPPDWDELEEIDWDTPPGDPNDDSVNRVPEPEPMVQPKRVRIREQLQNEYRQWLLWGLPVQFDYVAKRWGQGVSTPSEPRGARQESSDTA